MMLKQGGWGTILSTVYVGRHHRRPRQADSATPDFYGRAALAAQPTDALPGTAEKIEVMRERKRRRLAIFHPDDARPPE